MLIKDILNENSTDVVARFYIEASRSHDRLYNIEDVEYKEKNARYYDEHFKQWFAEQVVPVFTKPVVRPQTAYTNKPHKGDLQSPGYRGLQYAKAASGIPYDRKVQRYETNAARMVATQTMDGAKSVGT